MDNHEKEIRSLTRAETEIMKILWKLKKAFVKEIIEQIPEPKPAYNTVSTFVRILEKKEVVGHTTFGNTNQYFPLIEEEEFKRHEIQQLVENYFDNSMSNLVSFFVKENQLQEQDYTEILQFIEKNKTKP
tara:strand:- start:674 stop:1063 length:390 start_codon:yes stop_codon:yes gene_type:complete